MSDFKRMGLVALTLATGIAANAPARAQFLGFGFRSYEEAEPAASPRYIQRRLERQGFRLTRPMRLNGDVVVVDAIDPDGRRNRLVVDAYSGTIVQRFATGQAAPERFATRAGEPDDPRVINGPNPGYLENGTLAPPAPSAPRAPAATRIAPKAKPKAVAKLAPAIPKASAPAAPPSPEPAQALQPARPSTQPSAQPSQASAATAPAKVEQPAVSVTPAMESPKAPGAAKASGTPTKGYANGVPINPLD